MRDQKDAPRRDLGPRCWGRRGLRLVSAYVDLAPWKHKPWPEEAEEPMTTCPNCNEPIRDPTGYQALLACLAKARGAEDTPLQRQLPNGVTPSPTQLDEELTKQYDCRPNRADRV
ncbi:hypothetical protein GCM10023320_81700 [Pseudonocardia adelaidensis]|uniref:Uncharacterized protein n=1 Tax=Pseudonocardia adelaidensis TaxID=648754 RepID=A0ABP9PC60_9PSEU